MNGAAFQVYAVRAGWSDCELVRPPAETSKQ
jgi:hypothetical protein